MKRAVILIIVFVIVISIIIGVVCSQLQNNQGKGPSTKLGQLTKIMEDVNVPTINLIEKEQSMNVFSKIMHNVNKKKVDFFITGTKSYTITVPNYNDFNFSGKGLVIAASGNRYRYMTGLYMNLYVLRKYHKSNIPVEIFYVGKMERFPPKIKEMILSLGSIRIYDLLERINTNITESELRGYQTKPLAVICSSFEEVVLVDADSLLFIDPSYFFDLQGYIDDGMVLFKDYVDCLSFVSKNFIENIGIGTDKYCNYTNDYEIDSSCVVVNKEEYWESLFTICVINVKSDSYHKSKNVLGDKDTWLIGSMFNNKTPFISRPSPKIMITDEGKVIVGHLQSTIIDGHEVFTHYNNQKIVVLFADVSNFTYADIKNPKSGIIINYGGTALPNIVIESFEYAKHSMKLLDPHIPSILKEKIMHYNGISNKLIN
jgi:hypothetical protein